MIKYDEITKCLVEANSRKQVNDAKLGIKTNDLGYFKSAKIIPKHQVYYTQYTLPDFKARLKAHSGKITNKKLAEGAKEEILGMINSIIKDYDADLGNKELDRNKTIQFYNKFITSLNDILGKNVYLKSIKEEANKRFNKVK